MTAAPSILALFDDSLEFQLVLPTLGIAHPTGYPLYTLAGGLWSRLLPFGAWAWRANLFSAVAGAMAVALVFALTRRIVARPDLPWRSGPAWQPRSPLDWDRCGGSRPQLPKCTRSTISWWRRCCSLRLTSKAGLAPVWTGASPCSFSSLASA
ncbi:MAG: DUF2723 domain-containing protein [Anaerolineales bacterium]|nr:DUF2723 domain-containing protein [Anaerolineales bacterium]